MRLLGQYWSFEELVAEVQKEAVLFKHSGGGVTISGGEPLLEPDFAARLLGGLRGKDISTGVDTSGYIPWSTIEYVLPYVDFFLWDIKHMDSDKHRELTGVPNELILDNARKASDRDVPLYIRVPVIPGCNDSEDNIRAMCEFVHGLQSVVEVHLLPFHHLGRARYESLDRLYPMDGTSLIPNDAMQRMQLSVESYGLKCRIGG